MAYGRREGGADHISVAYLGGGGGTCIEKTNLSINYNIAGVSQHVFYFLSQ